MNGDPWWRTAVLYEIVPRSFQDTNGDGSGDLNGIVRRLDYLQWLGVTGLWVGPFYPSPMADFGYDVADYTGVHPLFGTIDEFDRLLAEAHRRGLRVLIDLVPNHTSSRHPWFAASRSSLVDPKRDWYLWRDPGPNGGPPNNWLSLFGGEGWTYAAERGQYYYHTFSPEEPELNWRNPEVRSAIAGVMRFWLDRGVDGFRIDALWFVLKDERYRDNPVNPDHQPNELQYNRLKPAFTTDQGAMHEVVLELRRIVDRYPDRVLVGELYLDEADLIRYYGPGNQGVQLPVNHGLILAPWEARRIAVVLDMFEGALPPGAWPHWALNNHDKPRLAGRIGASQIRVAALLLLTLRGTPVLYYGDEIGLTDSPLPREATRDPQALGDPNGPARDPFRGPMPWNGGLNGGFTTGTPWLPLADTYSKQNVAAQQQDPDSLLTLYRRMIALRQREPALQTGDYTPLPAEGDVLAFLRQDDAQRFLVALNLGGKPASFETDRMTLNGEIAVGTVRSREGRTVTARVELEGNEGVVIRLR